MGLPALSLPSNRTRPGRSDMMCRCRTPPPTGSCAAWGCMVEERSWLYRRAAYLPLCARYEHRSLCVLRVQTDVASLMPMPCVLGDLTTGLSPGLRSPMGVEDSPRTATCHVRLWAQEWSGCRIYEIYWWPSKLVPPLAQIMSCELHLVQTQPDPETMVQGNRRKADTLPC